MKLPIGVDNFREIIEGGYDYIDKTMLIKQIYNDSAKAMLITRPRRFGKTLNMSMLQHFFSASVKNQPTAGLFDKLKISKSTEMDVQGKFPVIFLSFKDVKDSNFQDAYKNITAILRNLYEDFVYLQDSEFLTKQQKIDFTAILEGTADSTDVGGSLLLLSKLLHYHHHQNVWILLDEYDTPIHEAYQHGYYDEMIVFMRVFLGKALKGNDFLHKAVLTGILMLAKESLFSGLTHLIVYSMLKSKYGEFYGFTEEEVSLLLQKIDKSNIMEEVKSWYNGYQVGSYLVYNPWSIINCVCEDGLCSPHWINTSDNKLLKEMLVKASVGVKADFEKLLRGEYVNKIIHENLPFSYLDQIPNEFTLWTLLLASGYVSTKEFKPERTGYRCQIFIPNREVKSLYQDIFLFWLSSFTPNPDWHHEMISSMFAGDVGTLKHKLSVIIEQVFSFHDVTKNKGEAFYHGFILGLVSLIHDTHIIKSNKESGHGRYDVLIYPRSKRDRGVIIELKFCDSNVSLNSMAEKALKQMKEKEYSGELLQHKIYEHVFIAIAFAGKEISMLAELEIKNS